MSRGTALLVAAVAGFVVGAVATVTASGLLFPPDAEAEFQRERAGTAEARAAEIAEALEAALRADSVRDAQAQDSIRVLQRAASEASVRAPEARGRQVVMAETFRATLDSAQAAVFDSISALSEARVEAVEVQRDAALEEARIERERHARERRLRLMAQAESTELREANHALRAAADAERQIARRARLEANIYKATGGAALIAVGVMVVREIRGGPG